MSENIDIKLEEQIPKNEPILPESKAATPKIIKGKLSVKSIFSLTYLPNLHYRGILTT